ncbi:LysR family transcriptional regulator ArgP [Frigidibacter sp.]|uniref:LysR family transcriptional regulator ArgP n=1 Tax=Frigidibacter sp. TaxID=2586418 RepID=UPI002735DE48|nr:LysR family transcriptional regulator ArgP [Frigidibacter sp.]MDP3340893.1 LysR family transcriptional regulator ArgP [Frigidibacter sp.]
MFDPAHLATLAAVLRLGSFEAAAAAQNVTPPAVSQRIRALEERAGTVLVERTQPARATPAGARLARHHEELRLLEQGLARDLGRAAGPAASVRIAVNADSLATWFLPALAAVEGMLFDLVIDDQDHSADWLRRGEVMAAVTGHPGPVQGCDARPLGSLRYIATASPGFVARWFAGGVTAEALEQAPALIFNAKDRLQADWAAAATGARPALPGHRIGSSEGFVTAALLGIGWGLNPEPLVTEHLRDGRLVVLRPDLPLDVALHWQWIRLAGEPLAPLTAAVRAAARRGLAA